MMFLLRNAECFAPQPLGRVDLLVAGDKITWLGRELPPLPVALQVDEIDLEGRRLIPGLIDCHAHITGGGGETGGARFRVPRQALSEFTGGGVTTVVGLLGTDDVTRTITDLVATTRGLTEEGITAYCFTGGYHLPVITLTGDLYDGPGPGAMQLTLEAARPLVEMLWLRETEAEALDTPERRAAFDQRLKAALGRIADTSVRNHYAAEIKARRAELFRLERPSRPSMRGRQPGRGQGRGPGREFAPIRPTTPEARNSELARRGGAGCASEGRKREAGILLTALLHIEAAVVVEAELEEMTLITGQFRPIRDALLAAIADGSGALASIGESLGYDPVKRLSSIPEVRRHPLTKRGVTTGHVVTVLTDAIAIHEAQLAFGAEKTEAVRDLPDAGGEDWTWRIKQAGYQLKEAAHLGTAEPQGEEAETVSEIQRMLDNQVYKSKKR